MGEHTNKAKGHVKQAVGALTGNDKLRHEGQRDEAKGVVQGRIRDAKDLVKDMRSSHKSGKR